ncbi:MAG: ABC transporter substrate-binding protein, partial [Desulfobacteraceae bacterium]|nr:ABC transporter substrate-binding protein [Desulfobacteraceae bacterium]
ILAITISSTGCSMACSPLAERYKIAAISPWSIGAWPGGFNDWTFRNTMPDSASVPALMKAAKEKFGINRCAIMYDYTDDWSVQCIPIFRNACKAAGIEIPLPPQSYARGDIDYSAQLTKIKPTNPDGIFMPAQVREGSLIVSQSRKLGIKARFLGTSGFISADGLCQAGPAAEGTASVRTFHYKSSRPEFIQFYKRLKQKYPKKDIESYTSVTGYDAIMLLVNAAKRAGITPPITPEKRKALRDALASTSGLKLASGTFTYKGSGDALPRVGVLVTFDSKSCTFRIEK